MDRVGQLQRFGEVKPWLADRVRAMSFEAWARFYDSIEGGQMKLPSRIEETMPRTDNGSILNPESSPPQKRAALQAAWDEWEKTWGAPPWKQPQKELNVRPRIGKFKD